MVYWSHLLMQYLPYLVFKIILLANKEEHDQAPRSVVSG